MKIAIQISGIPRFAKEFDDFISNLTDYVSVDWFFYFWNSPGDPYVPPNWPCSNVDQTRTKIKNNLPANHNLAYIDIHKMPDYTVDRPLNLTPWSNPKNIWYMFNGIERVNQIRKAYDDYDLVIRTRGDVGISQPISCTAALNFLKQNPNAILMPSNHRLGLTGNGANDFFAIGLPDTIDRYAEVFYKLFDYNDAGVPYHPETLLAHHLSVSGIQSPMTNFECKLREYKMPDGTTDWGRWN